MYCIKYEIKKGDTLYSISRHFNISINSIMESNPLANMYHLMIGETIYVPVCVPQYNFTHNITYQVKDEDTLGKILDENSINMADLIEFNQLDDIYLRPGMTLRIPALGEDEDNIMKFAYDEDDI